VCKTGQLWKMGDHRLLCGDCTIDEQVQRLMDGNPADMVFTDPPYGVSYDTNTRPSGKPKKSLGAVTNDDLTDEDFSRLLSLAIANMINAMAEDAAWYICFGGKKYHLIAPIIVGAGLHTSSRIIWYKNQFILGRSDYHTQWEFLIYGWREGKKHNFYGGRDQSDVWEEKQERHGTYLHPTMKPVELIGRAITNSSQVNDTVIDLFGGSGSTLIACQKLGRRCYCMEIDPHYCDVIINRWQQFTGLKAELING
jgi:DNA modification methylase